MKKFASSLQPTSTRVNQSTPVYLPKALTSCSHVFIKDDPIHRNLTPAYSGPFKVVTRHEHTFTVLKGDKLISVNINNLKPGFVLSCPETQCNPGRHNHDLDISSCPKDFKIMYFLSNV